METDPIFSGAAREVLYNHRTRKMLVYDSGIFMSGPWFVCVNVDPHQRTTNDVAFKRYKRFTNAKKFLDKP